MCQAGSWVLYEIYKVAQNTYYSQNQKNPEKTAPVYKSALVSRPKV